MNFVVMVASNAMDLVSLTVAMVASWDVAEVSSGFLDSIIARFRVVERTILAGLSVALGVGCIEVNDCLVVEGSSVVDGETAAVNILPEDG